MKAGSIISIIAGVIRLCASRRSLHADPSAMKIDPKVSTDSSRKPMNQATIRGSIASR